MLFISLTSGIWNYNLLYSFFFCIHIFIFIETDAYSKDYIFIHMKSEKEENIISGPGKEDAVYIFI